MITYLLHLSPTFQLLLAQFLAAPAYRRVDVRGVCETRGKHPLPHSGRPSLSGERLIHIRQSSKVSCTDSHKSTVVDEASRSQSCIDIRNIAVIFGHLRGKPKRSTPVRPDGKSKLTPSHFFFFLFSKTLIVFN